jgi:phosphate transport system substrate-binding protein
MNPVDNKQSNAKRASEFIGSKGFVAPLIGAFVLATTTPILAQESQFVRIDIPEKDITLEGELVSFDDEVFVIKSELGELKVVRDGATCIGIACPEDIVASAPALTGRDVILKAIEGETQIKGELVDVDSEHYVIRNFLGEFRILKADVECGGPACPNIEFYDPQFAIHAVTPEVRVMISELLQGYATANDQVAEVDGNSDAPETVRLYTSADHELVAEISLITETSQDALQIMSENTPDIAILDQQQFSSNLSIVENVDPATLEQTLLAYDGQVIIGNQGNPVRDLSSVDVATILGESDGSWLPYGGGDFPISVHMVNEASTTGADASLLLSNFGASDASGIVTHDTEAEVIAAVEADRNAIGFVHRAAAVVENSKMLDLRKTCGLTSSPSNFDMQVNQYPLTQPVYAFGRSAGMHPVAESFVAWTQTSEAQQHTGGTGFVSTQLQRIKMQDMGVAVIHTAAVEPDFDGAEFASMMRELRNADRLSITFRFKPGSAALDDISIDNVKDLAERLRRSEFDGQEILLVGFADSIGPADRNTVLSQRRAETVETLLAAEFDPEARERLNIQPMSFGEQMPLDCNETDDGRANNRRVEVWARVPNQ